MERTYSYSNIKERGGQISNVFGRQQGESDSGVQYSGVGAGWATAREAPGTKSGLRQAGARGEPRAREQFFFNPTFNLLQYLG